MRTLELKFSRRSRRGVLAVIVMLLVGAARVEAQAPTVGQVAPVITVANLDGKPVRVGLTAGKRGAVIEFWATWCELCRALLPSMRAAQKQFGDRVDFYGVNVTVNDPLSHVRRYVAENHPPFVAVYDDHGLAVRAFGALATSYVVVVDRNGRIAYTGDGADQDMPAILSKVLGK
ncbi:MAG: TlpA family protein disulfide reductase [Gemmatimonadales bacterium]